MLPASGTRMTSLTRWTSSFIFGAVLVGCTSWKLGEPPSDAAHPASPIPQNAAEVCAVRTSVLAQAVTFPTRDNGVLVGATRGPTYFCWFVAAGHHRIEIEADEKAIAYLDAEAGKRYWLKQEVDNIFGIVRCRPVWVTEEVAQQLLEESSHEVLVGVPGDEKLPPSAPIVPSMPRSASS